MHINNIYHFSIHFHADKYHFSVHFHADKYHFSIHFHADKYHFSIHFHADNFYLQSRILSLYRAYMSQSRRELGICIRALMGSLHPASVGDGDLQGSSGLLFLITKRELVMSFLFIYFEA